MKRFYTEVATDRTPEGWRILLDGKPVRTPAGKPLLLPAAPLAEAVAEEWRVQDENILPATMPMLRMANTVLDGITANRAEVEAALLRFGAHDLLSYRADAPPALVARQKEAWDPMLAWAAEQLRARLAVTTGIGHIDQPPESLTALQSAIAAQDDFALAGLHVLASITGSLILALALVQGAIHPAQAFALSRLDEDHQAEIWGTDSEAAARAQALAREMDVAAAFIAASRSHGNSPP